MGRGPETDRGLQKEKPGRPMDVVFWTPKRAGGGGERGGSVLAEILKFTHVLLHSTIR
jgi:hypothetical protein